MTDPVFCGDTKAYSLLASLLISSFILSSPQDNPCNINLAANNAVRQ